MALFLLLADWKLHFQSEAVAVIEQVNNMLKLCNPKVTSWKVWDIDLKGEKQGAKNTQHCMLLVVSKWEVPANVEDLITLQTEMAIDGKPVPEVYNTAEQEAEVLCVTDTTALDKQ